MLKHWWIHMTTWSDYVFPSIIENMDLKERILWLYKSVKVLFLMHSARNSNRRLLKGKPLLTKMHNKSTNWNFNDFLKMKLQKFLMIEISSIIFFVLFFLYKKEELWIRIDSKSSDYLYNICLWILIEYK